MLSLLFPAKTPAQLSRPSTGRILTLLLVWVFSSGVHAASDSGASLNLLLKAKLTDDWFLLSRSNIASRDRYKDWFFGYTGVSLGYQLDDRWSVRLGYRQAWIELDEWQVEQRPFAEAYFAKQIGDMRFSNRTRLEFRYFDYRDDELRLRNEITLQTPWKLTSLELQPYLEEEIFIGDNINQVETNWLTGGLAWRPQKGLKLKAGYRWNRFRVGDDWRDRDVLVLGLNLYF